VEQPAVMPRSPSTSLGMTSPSIDTAASSPVALREKRNEAVLHLLSSDRCLNRRARPIRYPMVKKLLHTRYRVQDLEKTISFYKDVLGLQEIRRHTSGRGSQLVFLKAPDSDEEIEICKFDGSGPIVVGPDLTHLAFEVEDLDKFAKHAASKGYPLSDGPHSTNGGRIAFIDAPEGYEIELIERGKK
jgi:lactoylglutathione lyase